MLYKWGRVNLIRYFEDFQLFFKDFQNLQKGLKVNVNNPRQYSEINISEYCLEILNFTFSRPPEYLICIFGCTDVNLNFQNFYKKVFVNSSNFMYRQILSTEGSILDTKVANK